jgi:hypothetical protein
MLTITCSRPDHRQMIEDIVTGYGPAFRAWLDAGAVRVVVLESNQRYSDVCAALRGSPIDRWPAPPAGLFVVAERTVYLRSLSRTTIAHELVHAYDCARGGGAYFSTSDPTIRRLFRTARGFVTPYAASGIDEYVAESGRALHRHGNDSRSSCPRATPERLHERDPEMYAYLRALFAQYPPAPARAPRRRRQPRAAGAPASSTRSGHRPPGAPDDAKRTWATVRLLHGAIRRGGLLRAIPKRDRAHELGPHEQATMQTFLRDRERNDALPAASRS